jgi:nucleotide-binding universal stress UspA family protein
MIHVNRVLFPTDGSDCAERARRHAVHLADHLDAVLHVIHVEERDVELSDVVEIDENDLLADLHGAIRGESFPLADSRVRERTVAYPSAAGGILTYGVEHDADLVVLGTHGKRGVRRLMLGSVAEEVVRKAPCPVVTVGRGAIPPEDMEGGTMLVPVDFSEHQTRLLDHVRELAPVYDMDATVLHVVEMRGVPDAYGVYSSLPDPGKLGERAEKALDEEVESLRADGIDVSVAVKSGHPADQILTYAEEIDAAFVTIATHGRTGLERMLMGSVAEKVIRRAPCPVCTVKSFGQSLVEKNESEEENSA